MQCRPPAIQIVTSISRPPKPGIMQDRLSAREARLTGCSGKSALALSPAGFEPLLSRIAKQSFTLGLLARKLACATDGLALLTRALFGWLLVKPSAFHLAEDAFSLHLPFQCFERLIDIVVAYEYLQLLLLILFC
jgi:hypothetical protein